jgi:hypothetical protein
MSVTELTQEDMVNSLTGFDEIAITKHMGLDVYTDAETKPIGIARCLIFVAERRDGSTDVEARNTAMNMTLKDVQEYFSDDDEVTPDEPDTDQGKDDSQTDEQPKS